MFRKTSSQSSLLDAGNYISEALPKTDWSFTFREKIFPLIDENKFKHLYYDKEGRPNASIKVMVSLLIFMGLEKLNWRAAEFQFARRIDWMVATFTEIGKAFIDHTTLFKFYQRLEADDNARGLFTSLAARFSELCGTSVKKQRTDSFFIHGWLRLLSRYGLFKETIRKFLLSLRKQKPGLYENIKAQLSKNYLEKDFDLTEKDKKLAQRRISEMAKDLYKIVIAFENHRQVKHYETFKILTQVFKEQCDIKSHSGNPEIIIKDKPDKNAINSPHNPQARYVRKVNQQVTGDKGFLTQTCDPDNKTQFITDVQVSKATEHDSTQQPEIQKRLIKNNFKPDKHYEDAGFVNGKTIIESKKNGIDLEGPTAGRSQSFESYESNTRPLDAGDFDTSCDEATGELIVNKCPGNHIPLSQEYSKKTGKLNIHFDPANCKFCSLKKRCPARIGLRVTTYSVSEEDYIGAVRHHKYMENPEYRKECAVRAGAESLVSELTRAHGMRKSRHREPSRTRLQLIFAAMACNVKRFIEHGHNYGYLVPQPG